LYMIGSERGVYRSSFRLRGRRFGFLVDPPLPPHGGLFLVSWGLGFRRWAASFHGFAKPKTSLMP
jgi:hypothetical protein